MVEQLINVGIGLVLGLVTGYVFERRATRAAEQQAAELEAELRAVRQSVYSMGGNDRMNEGVAPGEDLVDLVRAWSLSYQDASGSVSKSRLISHFLEDGHSHAAVEQAIAELCARGQGRDLGNRLEMA
jgi:hypothetical protein